MLQRRTWLTIAAVTTMAIAMGPSGCKKRDPSGQGAPVTEWRVGVYLSLSRADTSFGIEK